MFYRDRKAIKHLLCRPKEFRRVATRHTASLPTPGLCLLRRDRQLLLMNQDPKSILLINAIFPRMLGKHLSLPRHCIMPIGPIGLIIS